MEDKMNNLYTRIDEIFDRWTDELRDFSTIKGKLFRLMLLIGAVAYIQGVYMRTGLVFSSVALEIIYWLFMLFVIFTAFIFMAVFLVPLFFTFLRFLIIITIIAPIYGIISLYHRLYHFLNKKREVT